MHSIESAAWSWVLKCEYFLTRNLASAQCLQQPDVSVGKSEGNNTVPASEALGTKVMCT